MKTLPLVLAGILCAHSQNVLAQTTLVPGPQTNAPQAANDVYEKHRQAAIRINDLALQIHSLNDANRFVSAIADVFSKELPPVWASRMVLDRVAEAEYQSIQDASKLIPEQRIADVWNKYAKEIGAPDETMVTAAEIHNMRDAQFTVAQRMWARGMQNIWSMPNVFAVGPDGKVANGCRAVEAIRVMHDLDGIFQNLRSARDRVKKGVVVSDRIHATSNSSAPEPVAHLEAHPDTNPIRPAEVRYTRDHGEEAYSVLLVQSFAELFPPQ